MAAFPSLQRVLIFCHRRKGLKSSHLCKTIIAWAVRSLEITHLDKISLIFVINYRPPPNDTWKYQMWKRSIALWWLTDISPGAFHTIEVHNTVCCFLESVSFSSGYFPPFIRHNHSFMSQCMSKHCGVCTLIAGAWFHGNTQQTDISAGQHRSAHQFFVFTGRNWG